MVGGFQTLSGLGSVCLSSPPEIHETPISTECSLESGARGGEAENPQAHT